MEDIRNMSASLLLENFRALCRGLGATRNPDEVERLAKKADLYEQEIARRMAW